MTTSATLSTARRKMRARLHAQGLDPSEIESRVQEAYPPRGQVYGKPKPSRGGVAVIAARRRYENAIANKASADLIERLRFELEAALHGRDEAARMAYARQKEQPDDGRHKPTYVDALLKGPARAEGQAARVVRSKNTITRWQYDEREAAT